MTKSRVCTIALLILLALVVGFHLYARLSAFKYGHACERAFDTIGASGFADTAGLRDIMFEDKEIAPYARVVHRLSWVAGNCNELIQELQRGLIYLSEQMNLPEPERFRSPPPALKHLTIVTTADDHSNRAVATAAFKLFESYQARLLSF